MSTAKTSERKGGRRQTSDRYREKQQSSRQIKEPNRANVRLEENADRKRSTRGDRTHYRYLCPLLHRCAALYHVTIYGANPCCRRPTASKKSPIICIRPPEATLSFSSHHRSYRNTATRLAKPSLNALLAFPARRYKSARAKYMSTVSR